MTSQPSPRPYGLWPSPISPASMARSGGFSNLTWHVPGWLAWLESSGGRGVVVLQPPDGQAPRDLNANFSVRAHVGYGGGDFTLGGNAAIFVDSASERLFRQPMAGGQAVPITPQFGQAASPALSPNSQWVVYVHSDIGQDNLAIVDINGKNWPQKLVSGEDFYMQPAWHPQGDQLAWIAWNHPNMPWDGTWLRLGQLEFHGTLPTIREVKTVDGSEDVAIFQPEFSPDGRYLAYISDRSGWGQLWLYDLATNQARQLTQAQAEHGTPAWVQGLRTFAFDPSSSRIYFVRNQQAFASLWQIDLHSGEEKRLPLEDRYTRLEQITAAPGGWWGDPPGRTRLALIASGARTPARVISYTTGPGNGKVHIWRRSTSEELPDAIYSSPQAVQWEGMDGKLVHGLLYPPHNPDFTGIGLPPLVVYIHGGPTSQSLAGFDAQAQFFTTRGYAYLQVNYRGSTGYGRAYQDALRGNWGVVDVEDAVSGARALAEAGRVDPQRKVIMGGSAGGYTVLRALQLFPKFFKAAICLYGISNQFTAATETHKFEECYTDTLIGILPEAADLYRDRSPIFFADQIVDPIALFQGEDDQVVRRNQSDEMVAILQRKGVPHIYHVYPGEGHGFRQPQHIEHFYQSIEAFLRQWVLFS